MFNVENSNNITIPEKQMRRLETVKETFCGLIERTTEIA
jgi:hypothetical protein